MDEEDARFKEETEVDLVEQAYVYVTTTTSKTYPDGFFENQKRIIRRKAKKLVVRDEELHVLYQEKRQGQPCK